MRNCTECIYAVLVDCGYSNYTVEGTDFHCAKKLHPDAPFDVWYGEEEKLKLAETCSEFVEGRPVKMDVEHSDERTLDPLQMKIWEMYNNS